jgi:hypothetical protein
MGGTLTKERPGLRWCQYLPAHQALGLLREVGVGCGGGGTSLVGVRGLVEHTVGSSGHRPPVGGVPGTGRSSDHEPLSWLSSSRSLERGWGLAGVVGGSGGVGVVGCLRTAQWTRASL